MSEPCDDLPPAAAATVQPTPEHGWLWRRLYTFLVTTALLGLMTRVVLQLDDPTALRAIALQLAGLLALTQLLYMGGATLTDIWRLVSAVRTTRIVRENRGGAA